jgi:hypothetical protein
MEDLDTDCLGHYIKIWADRYACTGEIKGGTVPLYHKTFVITSNYTPEQLFTKDPTMAKAIRRRFTFTHMSDPLDCQKLRERSDSISGAAGA